MTTSTAYSLTGFKLTLDIVLTETNSALNYLSGSIDWGDGTSTSIPRSLKVDDEVRVSYTHVYSSGFYVVKVSGFNYRSPRDTDVSLEYVSVGSVSPIIAPEGGGFLRGPILPSDNVLGQWMFDVGTDSQVIVSNLRSLLLTRCGERLMDPDFGTNIHQLVFDLNTPVLTASIETEISRAVSKYEPRVRISSIVTEMLPNERSVRVDVAAECLGQFFSVGVTYT